ncbi:hypothetical protein SODG_003932 [Sodalis praecaptivus]|nr:hypothetical protein NVIRENTERO_02229 [Sodalis praecaptivus]
MTLGDAPALLFEVPAAILAPATALHRRAGNNPVT